MEVRLDDLSSLAPAHILVLAFEIDIVLVGGKILIVTSLIMQCYLPHNAKI